MVSRLHLHGEVLGHGDSGLELLAGGLGHDLPTQQRRLAGLGGAVLGPRDTGARGVKSHGNFKKKSLEKSKK